jgi:hypothetical protein
MSSDNGTRWGSKAVLVVLAALCAGGARYGTTLQQKAATSARATAEERAVSYVHGQLAAAVRGWSPGDETKKLANAVQSGILGDSNVSAVRVWTAQGALVFSTVPQDAGTVDGTSFADLTSGDIAAVQDDSATVLRTFAPAGAFVGEVQQDAVAIDTASHLPWKVAQFALLGVALILFVAAFFTGNAPRAKKQRAPARDDGKAESVEAGTENSSRAQGDDDVDPATVKLHQRTQKAEASRRAMEDQLNVLRSQIQSGDAGASSRISELEGSLQDAHSRVVAAEEKHVALKSRIADLEAAAAKDAPGEGRIPALEQELQAARSVATQLQGQFAQLEARAVQAETAGAAHAAQLEEAHVKAGQAETLVQEVVDRAMAAERQVAELQAANADLKTANADLKARATTGESNGHGTDQQLRELHDQLAAAGSKAAQLEGSVRDATARTASAEELVAAAETRAAEAETLAVDTDAKARARIRELEQALRDAKSQAAVSSQLADGTPEPVIADAPSTPAASKPDTPSKPTPAKAPAASEPNAPSKPAATAHPVPAATSHPEPATREPAAADPEPVPTAPAVAKAETAVTKAETVTKAEAVAKAAPAAKAETAARPETAAQPAVPEELDEDSRVRAELERIGEMLEQSHEAGDVNGLRSRLAKSAARKKGRTVDPATRS